MSSPTWSIYRRSARACVWARVQRADQASAAISSVRVHDECEASFSLNIGLPGSTAVCTEVRGTPCHGGTNSSALDGAHASFSLETRRPSPAHAWNTPYAVKDEGALAIPPAVPPYPVEPRCVSSIQDQHPGALHLRSKRRGICFRCEKRSERLRRNAAWPWEGITAYQRTKDGPQRYPQRTAKKKSVGQGHRRRITTVCTFLSIHRRCRAFVCIATAPRFAHSCVGARSVR